MEQLKKHINICIYFLMEQFIEPLEKSLHMCFFIIWYVVIAHGLWFWRIWNSKLK